jgi:hypothetical protein
MCAAIDTAELHEAVRLAKGKPSRNARSHDQHGLPAAA